MTSPGHTVAADLPHPAQERPTAARTPRRASLGARLALSVALSVATVVALLAYVGTRIVESQLESDLREAARLTAVALADDLELQTATPAAGDLLPRVRDFLNAAADISAVSIYRAADGAATPLLSTSEVITPPLSLIQHVMAYGSVATSDAVPHHSIVASPVVEEGTITGVVAVAVSLRAVEQLRQRVGLFAVAIAAFAIFGITLLIHLLAHRLVLAPLNEVRRIMTLARGGDLSSRAQVRRPPELRELAEGLNAMLAELDDLHRSLNERVEAATEELRQRNAQIVGSYESMLQLRETAQRAQQLAAIGQTLATVAHQIGTPLNLVSGHVQLLRQEVEEPAAQRRLAIVEEQVERVAAAVRDLLERARPQPERHVIDVGRVLDRIAAALRPRLTSAHVTLSITAAPALPGVLADETEFELALLNLVTNALDAMPDGGHIRIETAATDARVTIRVADTGQGIPDSVMPRIFEPWVTTKPPGRGSGLGLSITRDVIARLGGQIRVDSRAGEGAAFTIELPAARKDNGYNGSTRRNEAT